MSQFCVHPTSSFGRRYLLLLALAAPLIVTLACSQPVSVAPPPATEPAITPTTTTVLPMHGQQLAFLKNGNVWLVEVPTGNPARLTDSGDVQSFAWSADGERIATYHGHSLCFTEYDATSTTPCISLDIQTTQTPRHSQMIWSPDQQHIVIWNLDTRDPDGWFLVTLGDPASVLYIADPVDWGLALAPEDERPGYLGQPLFLPDGTLIGTLTHQWLCGSGGCEHQLNQFDWLTQRFTPHPINDSGFFNKRDGLGLSANGQVLVSFGTFHVGCGHYTTYVDVLDLESGSGLKFSFEQEHFYDLALSPDGVRAVAARGVGCNSENEDDWSMNCGLLDEFEVYAMQLWDFESGLREDLLPGLSPQWSPNGSHIAFRSCLAQTPAGIWESTSSGPPYIFIMDSATTGFNIVPVAEGSSPAWRP